ncbi:glutathione S-transferase family protein [Parasphingopyxis marina]|uniref:Glutathione S-transferase N-terminal domain-containing protein n=1 Tax=Parasphingopyxis marina TaxID=2761622 RepID=A0A842HXF8_9SPHN|nr:glutathione S-transferase N-terminal domain-containing protein [Parasphingopyxis marina]MBC2777021.1 glutathione S-transferase N-terminal domain-containing protein [Parasphingopyxis marina]
MVKFYLGGGPNPRKVALFLEEAGVPYEPIWVNTGEGEQHRPEFLALNPNAKIPVIVDGDRVVFDSNAILLYLAEKHEMFVPERSSPEWAEMISWLMFIASGLGPYSGQSVHFRHAAPEEQPYAITRYLFEARRHFDIVEDRLAGREWLVGDDYSIVDMALWGWAAFLSRILEEEDVERYPNVAALVERIGARPAAERAIAIGSRPGAGPPKVYANPHLFRYLATDKG